MRAQVLSVWCQARSRGLFALLLGVGAAAQAQVPVVPTPAELATKPPPTDSNPAVLPQRAPPPRELAKPQDELTLDVTGYDLADDAPPELRAALPALTVAYVGRGRSYEDLVNATAEVTRFLQRNLGYYLGYAYIPEQAPHGGVIRIAVLEGRLDRVVLEWNDAVPVQRTVVQAYLDRLKPGEVLKVRDVERVVFLVNDLRGITATFEVRAGSQPGTAALVVTAKPEARWSARADADVNGSRFLGQLRLAGLVGWNSPFGRGDGLTGNVLASQTGGLGFALASYTTPVGADGLKLGGTVSVVRYVIDPNAVPLGLKGDALSLTTYALYPVVRSRNLNLFALGSLERKSYNDQSAGFNTPKNTSTVSVGATGDFRDALVGGGVNTFEATLLSGRLAYPNGFPAGNHDAAGYGKVTANFTRLQDVLTNRVLLYAAVRVQQALRNLDTSEQFRLGGPDGVRAFGPGEGTGDQGALVTLELRALPPESIFGRIGRESAVSLFYDTGRVRFRQDPSKESVSFVNTASFSGAGVSWAWVRPGEYALRVSLAKPLTGTPRSDPKVQDPRLYAQFTKFFN